jgi:hypothetical protein
MMNFEDESYIRLYTRDTPTWLRLGFEGQAVLALLLRKVDRAGVLDGVDNPVADVALVLGAPLPFVEAAMPRLLLLGTAVHREGRLILPRFVEAQSATKSDKTRARDSRARRRDFGRVVELALPVTVRDEPSRQPSPRHAPSQSVTPSLALPSSAQPSLTERKDLSTLIGGVGLKVKFSPRWQPKPEHVEQARELGIEPAKFQALAAHARLKDYPRGFSSEDDTFSRALLFERQDQETRNFQNSKRASK